MRGGRERDKKEQMRGGRNTCLKETDEKAENEKKIRGRKERQKRKR